MKINKTYEYEKNYKVGDYFTGVLLETFKEISISRPRVRPVEMFPNDIRVEFPRNLREDHPIGTQFRAMVKVAQKTNKKTGKIIGVPYLVATDKSIDLVVNYSPLKQIYAIPIKDRLYEYVLETPEIKKNPLRILRESAYESAVEKIKQYPSKTNNPLRSKIIHSYTIQRSNGICESCNKPAPFTTINGMPYLEVHHLQAISEGGADHPKNVAAICPNCHRRTEKSEDREKFNNHIIKKILAKEKALGII